MTKSEIKDSFIKVYSENITRKGSKEFLLWLQSTDFFEAPASTIHHSAFEGGLAYHSLQVFMEAQKFVKIYKEHVNVSNETLAICTLLHDVCKIGCYKPMKMLEMRNVKENDQCIQKPYYKFNEDFKFGGHGSKSVYLIQKYMQLSDEEATAINCHMGSWGNVDEKATGDAFRQYPFAWLVHVADEASTFVIDA